ncbi:MAG TPA: secondary thiamine-phosphate synthase enzyme YjbQ [Ktedonobacterales bacterium]|nr:secondary thiamine-phosphate synthase enzyme YjbQ [Ktedonobacterales bacterium]
MRTIQVETGGKDQVVDITDMVEDFLRGAEQPDGVCVVSVAHTTCAVTTAELDPGSDLDLLQALRHLLPRQTYRHPHDPAHMPDHILSSLIGPSVTLPYANYRLALGTWQRVVLVELDGPRIRTIHLAAVG